MLELLIARGADVNRPESLHRYTPVTRAGFKGHRDITRVLQRHGAACPPAEVIGRGGCRTINPATAKAYRLALGEH